MYKCVKKANKQFRVWTQNISEISLISQIWRINLDRYKVQFGIGWMSIVEPVQKSCIGSTSWTGSQEHQYVILEQYSYIRWLCNTFWTIGQLLRRQTSSKSEQTEQFAAISVGKGSDSTAIIWVISSEAGFRKIAIPAICWFAWIVILRWNYKSVNLLLNQSKW